MNLGSDIPCENTLSHQQDQPSPHRFQFNNQASKQNVASEEWSTLIDAVFPHVHDDDQWCFTVVFKLLLQTTIVYLNIVDEYILQIRLVL